MQHSLSNTLNIRIGLVILCVNMVISLLFWAFFVWLAENEFKNNIELQTKHLSDAFTQQLWLFDLNATKKLSILALDAPDIIGLRLLDHTKKIITNEGVFQGKSVVHINNELRYGGQTLVGSIELAFVNVAMKEQRNIIFLTVFSIVGATLVVTFYFIPFLLERHLVRPLNDLQQDMISLADGKFRQSNLSGQKTEIQYIIDVFNKMASALAQREEDQRKTEQKLRESQERSLSLFNGSKDSIFTTTQQGVFIDINPAMLTLLGYTENEIDTIIAPDIYESRDDRVSLLEKLENEGSVDDYQVNFVTKDGRIKNCLLSASLWVNGRGKLLGYQGIIRDVTEQKRLQIQVAQAQKMEAIGTLAGGIAHDFNNILSIILGYTALAQEDAPPDSLFASDLEQVLKAGNRATDLVQQILAFSRQTEIERIPLQLQSLVKEGLKMLRSSIPTTIEIREDIDSQCGVVLADPTQVNQILMNLCTNANHAMEENGGILTITLTNAHIDRGNCQLALNIGPGDYVELIVSDSGSGIGPDVLDKIFDPYFTTKEVGKGTGLGLAIIHGIIVDYGGAITVESEPGQGTTFHVYFPVVAQEELSRLTDAEKVSVGHERILFIDDEEFLVEMGREMLRRLGYRVTARRNSLDALATFQHDPDAFDVVITDQTMPGMTGADLARHMLQIRPDIPIILCTGYSNRIDEQMAKSLGIKEFALKPLTKDTLSSLLRKVLDVS